MTEELLEITAEMEDFHSKTIELFLASPVEPKAKIGILGNVIGGLLVTSGFNDVNEVMAMLRANLKHGMSEAILQVAKAELEADSLSVKQD